VGVVSGALIFLIFAIIAWLISPIWCICRCCRNKACCKCCKQEEYPEQLTFKQQWGWFFPVIIFCVLIVPFAGIAYKANKTFSDALVHSDTGMMTNVGELIENMQEFVDDKVVEPIVYIKQNLVETVNNVSQLLSDNSVISNGTAGLIVMLNEFEDAWTNYTITVVASDGSNLTFDCGVCTTVGSTVGGIADEIQNQTDPIFKEMNATFTSINNKLIAVNATIVSAISDVTDTLQDLSDTLGDANDDIEDDYTPMVEDMNGTRELAYMILFCFPMLPLAFVISGAFFKKPPLFSISYSLLWFSFILMFFMLGLHLPIALVLNDVCNYLDVGENKGFVTLFNSTFAELLDGCLNDSKIAEVFGVGDDLEFANIEFGDIDSVSDAFSFDGLDDFQSELNSTTSDTFGGTVDDLLDTTNTKVSECSCVNSADIYTRDNISNLDPQDYFDKSTETSDYTELYTYRNTTIIAYTAETATIAAFELVISSMVANLTAISAAADAVENTTDDFVTSLAKSENLTKPIIEMANAVIENGTCGFVGDSYMKIVDENICGDINSSLATMIMSMLLIGVFAFGACIPAIKMVRKIRPIYSQFRSNGDGPVMMIDTGSLNYKSKIVETEI
jgi:hypothetical protein